MIGQRAALTPEKWEQVKRVFEAAARVSSDERPALLCRLCDGDTQVESEVNKLLAADQDAGSFLSAPALRAAPYFLQVRSETCFSTGDIVAGRFEIRDFLGMGGMGEVYAAWDSELRQDVAVKTIRSELSSNSRIIERFKQEVTQARGVANPSVCRVYDLFHHQNSNGKIVWFLTMQLLCGETLSDYIRRKGPIPVAQAFDIARQLIDGLSAAHNLGIVHRDFKSGNVILIDEESNPPRAVITDFGLAINVSGPDASVTGGAPVGTPDYMAPEQWSGEQVGTAADQYALGVVLCEMMTGSRPASWKPELSTKAIELPAGKQMDGRWESVIRRCLQLKPKDRFGRVVDITAFLDPRRRSKQRRKAVLWGTFLAVLSVACYEIVLTGPDARLENLTQLTPSTDLSSSPSLSRDGTMVAYESDREQPGKLDVYAQQLAGGKPVRITHDLSEDGEPDIAPDGSMVVYHSDRDGGGIYLSSTAGGTERLLVKGGRNPRFSPDGHAIAYWVGDNDESLPSGKLFVLRFGEKTPERIAGEFEDARLPAWSSDGQFILFSGCRAENGPLDSCSEWWATRLDSSLTKNTHILALLRANSITPVAGIGRWYGDVITFSGGQGSKRSIWEVKLRSRDLQAVGKPHRLSFGDEREYISSSSFSKNGTIAFSQLSSALHLWRVSAIVSSPTPSLTKITEEAVSDSCPTASASGKWLVFMRGLPSQREIWLRNLDNKAEENIPAPQPDKFSPIVNDNGNLIAYEANDNLGLRSIFMLDRQRHNIRKLCQNCGSPSGWFGNSVLFHAGNPSRIMTISADLVGEPKTLVAGAMSLSHPTWSPTNQYLLFTASSGENTKQIFALHAPTEPIASRQGWISITPNLEWSDKARWSPDGKTIYFFSNRDGKTCLWAQHFDPPHGRTVGGPYAVQHFHDSRISPARVWPRSLDIAVANNELYIDLGETTATVWIATMKRNLVRETFQKLR